MFTFQELSTLEISYTTDIFITINNIINYIPNYYDVDTCKNVSCKCTYIEVNISGVRTCLRSCHY